MMSSSPAISKDKAKPEERRAFPREALSHYVVLAFFGEDNWGKLVDMSESGMAIEFSRPPSLHERVNFTFQVMGCMPMPREEGGLGDSFEAAGEIKWVRDFERGAGVQFLDLAEKNREQIRQWLSFEASTNAAAMRETRPEVPATWTELGAPLTWSTESAGSRKDNQPLNELGVAESPRQTVEETPKLTDLEKISASLPAKTEETQDLPAFGGRVERAVEKWELKSSPHAHASVERLTFLVVSGCLAAFAVTAGVRIIMTRAARRVDTVESAPSLAAGAGEPATAANSSSEVPVVAPSDLSSPVSSSNPFPVPSTGSSAQSAPPFQVEVNANGKRWMLWFVRDGSKDGDSQTFSKSAPLAKSLPSTTRVAKQDQAIPAAKPAPRTFTMEAPNLSRPAGNSSAGNLSAEAPAIPAELTAPARDPIGGIITNRAIPQPAAEPVGGMVQVARLVHATIPIYPEIAKSSRVNGDVLVDALIDANGKVTSAKAISGPVLLRQAAMETVRRWKYEPARLDGQAVAMHLTVTVEFRLN